MTFLERDKRQMRKDQQTRRVREEEEGARSWLGRGKLPLGF